MDTTLLDASCRIGFAAYLHDLGKLAERARLEVPKDRLETHVQLYCPRHDNQGRIWYSHRHAAYTALAWETLEPYFPPLLGEDVFPFAPPGQGVDDSLVNAASRHHRPDTFLQWIVATADRLASGFEREEFDRYNASEDRTPEGFNHYTARQLTLFEQIQLDGPATVERHRLTWRYRLSPLSVAHLFPIPAKDYEKADNTAAQKEYRALWDGLIGALAHIPAHHRHDWSLWLDHFDSAWACYTQAIPAATAFNVRPEVSLYDHSRTTAALATALWRYHHDQGHDPQQIRSRLAHPDRPDWGEEKFLLVQGDLFGIQDFIFATGGETQRRAAKLLRGRSFYVSLLCECAALRVLEALQLPPLCQVINAAGKFLIVAPNTPATQQKLLEVQQSLDQWCLTHTYGQVGLGLAWQGAAGNDFLRSRQGQPAPFQHLMRRLFEQLNTLKTQRFTLCGARPAPAIFSGFLDQFHNDKGVCGIDGRSPAQQPLGDSGTFISPLAADQIAIGGYLTRYQRVLIAQQPLNNNRLAIPLFGYHVHFSGNDSDTRRLTDAVVQRELRRAWDFSLPQEEDAPLFQGYARRAINGYIPVFGSSSRWDNQRYGYLEQGDPEDPKTLEHLACDDRWFDEYGTLQGITALATLKGDVDNLGRLFERGLAQPSFAKMAALSRQLNAFFSLWLPWKCQKDYPNTYTVFAGGDDFFLIGPWRSTLNLAQEMRKAFTQYGAGNPDLHFSAGWSLTKPGLPIRQMGALAEAALEQAKDRQDGQGKLVKDGISCFGYTVGWQDLTKLWQIHQILESYQQELALSTKYLYELQFLADMVDDIKSHPTNSRLDSALWPSRFAYRTYRLLEAKRSLTEEQRKDWSSRLTVLLGGGLNQYGSAFKIALFVHLYHHRHST